MQYDLDPYDKVFDIYKDKYGFNIYINDLINKAGYNLTVTNQKEYEETEIPYSLYYSMGRIKFEELLGRMCKQLLFKIEMKEIINSSSELDSDEN